MLKQALPQLSLAEKGTQEVMYASKFTIFSSSHLSKTERMLLAEYRGCVFIWLTLSQWMLK